ncbi:MAG: hypothetical protein EXR99_13170 [Gemmataceae bacterium]|nr:hypothetical protein [Gemmataceae bacterium]
MKKFYALMLTFGLVGCGGDATKPNPPVNPPGKPDPTIKDMKKDGGKETKKEEVKKEEAKKEEAKKEEGKKEEGKKEEGKKDGK